MARSRKQSLRKLNIDAKQLTPTVKPRIKSYDVVMIGGPDTKRQFDEAIANELNIEIEKQKMDETLQEDLDMKAWKHQIDENQRKYWQHKTLVK